MGNFFFQLLLSNLFDPGLRIQDEEKRFGGTWVSVPLQIVCYTLKDVEPEEITKLVGADFSSES